MKQNFSHFENNQFSNLIRNYSRVPQWPGCRHIAYRRFLFERTCGDNNFQNSPARYLKTEYDKERIVYACEYLVRHLDMPPSLSELARVAGINEYKLKRGFKETFGNTVFGYLSDTRLELAKTDLLEKKKSASEIAFELGYSSVQHFSNAFKKKFGVSPNKMS